MRISDGSSYVCASALREAPDGRIRARGRTCGQQACTRGRVSGCARLGRWRGDRSERRMAADIDGPAKARFGVPGLDDVLCGGLTIGQVFLLEGSPGTGKTTIALRFLLEGAAAGEKGLYITLSETEKELRSEEHTSELQSLMRISYAVFCLKKKQKTQI